MSAAAEQGALTRSIVLWCPDWPIRAALLKYPSIAVGNAIALIEKGLVFACSAEARTAGVRRGLRVREAQARCPELVVLPYDPQADARFFEPILAAVEQTVPGVQPIRPGMCALRSRGPARYYGGEAEAAEVLLGVLAEHGVPDARVGVADGPFAAEQAARHPSAGDASEPSVLIVAEGGSPAFLAALPVDVMGDDGFTALCRRLGLPTLGALAGMAADELVERFGFTGARVHTLVTGRDAQVVVPRSPQRALERRLVFDEGLDRVDQLAFAARQTADDVIAGLTAAKLVATAVTVTIQTEDGAESSRTWLHPRWFTAADLVDRLRWQLQGVGPGTGALTAPVVQLVFAPESVDAAHHHEQGLWGDAPDERVHHALSRVQSMLGHDAVVTAALGGGRLLDDRQVLVPWGDRSPAGTAERAGQPWPGALPDPLPATVFLPRVQVELLTDSGEPVVVSDRGLVEGEPALFAAAPGARPIGSHGEALRVARPIGGWAGPWTVDERWWDAATARRVHRFSVVDADGTAWLLLFDGESWLAEARYD
ncbi:DNA polymerase Y family protein [Gryllotalpicola protaetiae]|uniref:DNA polymerase Y family protein n=1 Tax=Gryllotalpicola protaetiae TaxID=2419771 RepID=UPI001FE753F0|nr:DNA polymerase Y family protein [Gryllotalpicola protaetiae]